MKTAKSARLVARKPATPPRTPANGPAARSTRSADAADTKLSQLQERLLHAEAQVARLTRHWPGLIFTQRPDFSFAQVSPNVRELTGIPAENWRAQPSRFWEVVHEADMEKLKRQCRQAVATPGSVTTSFRIRHTVTGKVSHVLEHREAVKGPSGKLVGYQGLWLDTTRATVAEKRLMAAAWKETLAQVTTGLAHDFNNKIAGALSLSDLLLAKSGADDPKRPVLEMIKKSAAQMSLLVKRMVALHHGKTGARQYVDLNQAVTEVAELLARVLPRRVQLKTELAPEQVPVYLDQVEFGRVVLNLAFNAAEATPSRGELVLRVSVHTEAQALKNSQGTFPRLPCACLSAQDNGQGIAPRHLPSLFSPFFTTRPPANASGLGLYQARRFAEEHDGAVSVESTEGAGTAVRLWLPQADFTEAERFAAQNAERRRNLLLVGQPGAARDALAELLRAHKFAVVLTHTPVRARELLADAEDNLQGVLVSAAPGDNRLLGLVPELRESGLTQRIVLQVLADETSQVDTAILDKANLVIAATFDAAPFLQKLSNLFAAEPPA